MRDSDIDTLSADGAQGAGRPMSERWDESNPEWWKAQLEDRPAPYSYQWLVNEWAAAHPADSAEALLREALLREALGELARAVIAHNVGGSLQKMADAALKVAALQASTPSSAEPDGDGRFDDLIGPPLTQSERAAAEE